MKRNTSIASFKKLAQINYLRSSGSFPLGFLLPKYYFMLYHLYFYCAKTLYTQPVLPENYQETETPHQFYVISSPRAAGISQSVLCLNVLLHKQLSRGVQSSSL